MFVNKELYAFIENPKTHFAYKMHVAKELSNILKERGIFCITTDEKMQKRLNFYGVTKCKNILLVEKNIMNKKAVNVTISHRNSVLYKADVTIINNI